MAMRDSWDQRIGRAKQLAASDAAIRSLLEFYARVLTCQKEVYESLRAHQNWHATGSLDCDGRIVRAAAPRLLRVVADGGPEPLASEATDLLREGETVLETLLHSYWYIPSDRQFFAKALLQPYAAWLHETGVAPVGRERARAGNRCPFCGGSPQLSILERARDGDAGGRSLLCATCLKTWPFRRVICAGCGEEDERRLGYFYSPSLDHLRLDTCENCKRYLKTVDLTRLGLAVPLVDEVAGAPLDVWAREHGYVKLELNLVGL